MKISRALVLEAQEYSNEELAAWIKRVSSSFDKIKKNEGDWRFFYKFCAIMIIASSVGIYFSGLFQLFVIPFVLGGIVSLVYKDNVKKKKFHIEFQLILKEEEERRKRSKAA